jgi:hypothetical protein
MKIILFLQPLIISSPLKNLLQVLPKNQKNILVRSEEKTMQNMKTKTAHGTAYFVLETLDVEK